MNLRSLTARPAQSITEFSVVGLSAAGVGEFAPFEPQKGTLVFSRLCLPMLGLDSLDHGPNDLAFLGQDAMFIHVEVAEGCRDYGLGLAEACARRARALYESLILCGLRLERPAKMVTGYRGPGGRGGEAEKVLALRAVVRRTPCMGVVGPEGLMRMACMMADNQLLRMQVQPGSGLPETAIRSLIHALQLTDPLARVHQLIRSLEPIMGAGPVSSAMFADRCRLFAGDEEDVARSISAAHGLREDASALNSMPDRAMKAAAEKAVLAWADAYLPLLEELAAEVGRRMAMRPALWRSLADPDACRRFWAGSMDSRELLWGEPIPLSHLVPRREDIDAISEGFHRETERSSRFRRLNPAASVIQKAA